MRILAVDTSSKFLSLAVAQNAQVLNQTHRILDRRHSTQLVCLIDRILKRANLSLKKIDGLCVDKGPGSFTGLRVGVTAVKGLAFVLAKPVVAIPSLDILAQNAKVTGKGGSFKVCPIIDAKQNKVYACIYQPRNANLVRTTRYLLLPIEELLRRLSGEIFFLGDAIALYREQICQAERIKPIFAEESFWYPRAAQAIPLALARFTQKRFDDINRLVPLYLYPKECQIRRR